MYSPVQPGPDSNISPGRFNISLRPTDPLTLRVYVTTIRNIPLDLYILFDVSQSMREEIAAIQGVSDAISESTPKKYTTDTVLDFSGKMFWEATAVSKN